MGERDRLAAHRHRGRRAEVLLDGVVERHLPAFHGLGEQEPREDLRDRPDFVDGVRAGRDAAPALRLAVGEEPVLAVLEDADHEADGHSPVDHGTGEPVHLLAEARLGRLAAPPGDHGQHGADPRKPSGTLHSVVSSPFSAASSLDVSVVR